MAGRKTLCKSGAAKQAVHLLLLLCLFLMQGCGYRFGQGELPNNYQTISIPYAYGDVTGDFTAALVREVSRSGAFQYRRCGGEIVLQAAIIDVYEDNIGFRYDVNKEGEREDYIIPTETRITAVAEVSVLKPGSGCSLLGPAKIYASVDFDHQYYFGSNRTTNTSLGQLTDINTARDTVLTPLYQALAEKVADYVVHSW